MLNQSGTKKSGKGRRLALVALRFSGVSHEIFLLEGRKDDPFPQCPEVCSCHWPLIHERKASLWSNVRTVLDSGETSMQN